MLLLSDLNESNETEEKFDIRNLFDTSNVFSNGDEFNELEFRRNKNK